MSANDTVARLMREELAELIDDGYAVADIAAAFGVSSATVLRWANGYNAPHPALVGEVRKTIAAIREQTK